MTRSQLKMLERMARCEFKLGEWQLRGCQKSMLERMANSGWVSRIIPEGSYQAIWRVEGAGEDALNHGRALEGKRR